MIQKDDKKSRISHLFLTLLLLFSVEAPCLSIACQKASAHLSMSADPFTQPCDYFLFTCGSDRLSQDNQGKKRSQSIPRHPQTKKEKVTFPKWRGESKEMEDRRLGEESILDRKTLLLLYLREILGKSLKP